MYTVSSLTYNITFTMQDENVTDKKKIYIKTDSY